LTAVDHESQNAPHRLTVKGVATRRRIIEAAAAEFRERGVAATTLDHVLDRSRTSKGQLFHYFPDGREQLLLAVAGYEADQVILDQQPYLSRLNSWDAWRAWREAVIERYRRAGDQCAMSALILDIGRGTPAARALTAQLLQRWEGHLRVGIETMQQTGEIDSRIDASRAAGALVAGIQGGVTILLATGEIGNLEAAIDLVIDFLRNGSQPRITRSSGPSPPRLSAAAS
jgi:AcrR family transcriptional regulator